MRPATAHMYIIRERRRHRPPVPDEITGLSAMLAAYPSAQTIFQGEVRAIDGSIGVVFANPEMLNRLNTAVELHFDGTFKVQ